MASIIISIRVLLDMKLEGKEVKDSFGIVPSEDLSDSGMMVSGV